MRRERELETLDVGNGNPCLIAAELGTGHNGELERAFRLVDAAAEAGADAVKLQLAIAEEILHPLTGDVELPGGKIPLYERFKALERKPDFYGRIKSYAEAKGLLFLCTPFGLRSARILRDLGCKALKIASPELNHIPLLQEVASYDLPLIVSTGVSTLGDIDRAVRILRPPHHQERKQQLILLHCITAYPAPEEEYNLRVIPHLAAIFSVPAGLSDHSIDPILVPAAAAGLGACLVEKHFTLEKRGDGLDDPIALTPEEFSRMVQAIRAAESRPSNELYDRLRKEHGAERLEKVLGTGAKELAPSEKANYGRTNRSLHALRPMMIGEKLSSENVAVLRTEKNLSPGLGPEYLETVLGKRLVKPIAEGEGVAWKHLLVE